MTTSRTVAVKPGQPAWELALLYPVQGEWTEDEYLALTEDTNHPIELVDGFLEFLPMPDLYHQRLVRYLFKKLDGFVADGPWEALFAPSPVRLWKGRMREPDIFLVEKKQDAKQPPHGSPLVMEVVSPGQKSRKRDLQTKPQEYARAKIQEYWIVDPKRKKITVLTLVGKTYKVHGEFSLEESATSKLLPGFAVNVADVFASGEGS